MTNREIYAEIGFDSVYTDPVVRWTDVTPWVNAADFSSGKSYELDRMEAGGGEVTFDNSDGRFTPGRSTLVLLSERFNNLGALGASDTIALDTGLWATSGAAATVAPIPEGLSVSSAAVTVGGFLALRLRSDNRIPVVPGQLITVRARARASDAPSDTVVRVKANYDDSAGAFLTIQDGLDVASDGQWITVSHTFTVPAGAAFIRPYVEGRPFGALPVGTFTLDVEWLKVETPSPYAGKLEPKKPFRAYSVLDDNWIHHQCVNGALSDPVTPRWHSVPMKPHGFENGVGGWTAGGGTVAQSNTFAYAGTFSGRLTVVGSPSSANIRSPKVPVFEGRDYELSFRFKFTGTENCNGFITWYDSAGVAISTNFDGGLASSATWGQRTVYFTAPGGAVMADYGPTMLSPLTGEVYYFDEITFRPVANVDNVILDTPPPSSYIDAPLPSTYGPAAVVTDITKGRVFEFPGGADPGIVWLHGLQGDSDVVHVKAGQSVTLDADLRNFGTSVTLGISFTPYAGSEVVTEATPVSGLIWEHRTATIAAPSDGYVRAAVRVVGGTAQATAFKLRLDGAGSSTVGDASGFFPEFRGYVEQLFTEHEGNLSVATMRVIDGFSALGPLQSVYRSRMGQEAGAYTGSGHFYYWTCVESDDADTAYPEIGDVSLTLATSSTLPATGGFGSNGTFPYADGTSGSFEVDDTIASVGATLDAPYGIPIGDYLAVGFWYRPTSLPAVGTEHTLFRMRHSSGDNILKVSVLSDGTAVAEYKYGFIGIPSTLTVTHFPGSVNVDQNHLILVQFSAVPGSSTRLNLAVNTFAMESVLPTVYKPLERPSKIQWGGQLAAGIETSFMRGKLNHIVYMADTDIDPWLILHLYYAANTDPEDEVRRIGSVLGNAGWPGSKALDQGVSDLLSARWDDGKPALEELVESAESASGSVFMGPAGELVYHNRKRRLEAPVRWTLKEWQSGLRFYVDEDRILTEVKAQRHTGLTRVVRDPVAAEKYGTKSKTVDAHLDDPQEMVNTAGWILHRYSEQAPKCDTLALDGSTVTGDPELLAMAHGVALGDKLRFTDLPVTAPADEWDFFVEGIKKTFRFDGESPEMSATLQVSDASGYQSWIIEDEVTGVLEAPGCVLFF